MARNRRSDDDDDDDDRPRRKRRRDDDDDDDYDRPSGGSGNGMLIGIAIVAGVLVFGGVALLGIYFIRAEKPAPVAGEPPPELAQNPMFGRLPMQPQPAPKPKDTPPPKPDQSRIADGIIGLPSINPYVSQIEFGGGPDGYAAIVCNKARDIGKRIDIVKLANGDVQGQVLTDSVTDTGYSLSPDGKLLAILGSAPFEGNPVSLYTVADGKEVSTTTLYPKKADQVLVPDLIWVGFTSKDQLLSITGDGGFDLWSVPGMKRTTGMKGALKGGSHLGVNGFTHTPENFSLSNDGKTLALFNGMGFSFYDIATATETGRTEDFMKAGESTVFSGSAISPDGKRFACYFQKFEIGGTTELRVWDAKTGKNVSGGPVTKAGFPAGLAWWGSNHVVFWDGAHASGLVFSLETGQASGRLKTSIPGRFATVLPDGQLWGVVGGSSYEPVKGAAFLVRASPPASLQPNTQCELTPDGLKVK